MAFYCTFMEVLREALSVEIPEFELFDNGSIKLDVFCIKVAF